MFRIFRSHSLIVLALEFAKNDPTALLRRCQAYEKLERAEEAFRDCRLVAHADPEDSNVQETLKRLSRKVEENVCSF